MRGDELERRAGDDADLTEPGAYCVEQVGVVVRRAGDLLPLAGHDLQGDHVAAPRRGPLDRLGHIVGGTWLEDALRELVHEVAEVVGALVARCFVEAELALQFRWCVWWHR
ncbi:MAG TPA: hypothetical protein VFG33_06505 [Kribbella sp.]|uniref:hypothetical protein n=1 Tax=Kribbella sp. TaxID=1871183 RepID=UPI002D785F22|nr:hypothetical protein [Kribbella sp.]HET6293004.1 hypothetical protein [Kribbella sp.]